MEKDYLSGLQHFVVEIYEARCDKPLWVASEFCCSEMARRIGYKVLNDLPGAKARILQGVITDALTHDVLLIEIDGKSTIIDPTVWQIFKDKGSIVMGEYTDQESSLAGAKQIYGGDWKVSEVLNKEILEKELPELLNIIDKIIEENCEEA